MKKMFLLLLAVGMMFAFGTKVSAADTYTMNKESATISVGSTVQLSVQKNGTTVSGATWGSDNSSVATVSSSGLVTGVAAGSATITAMIDGNTVQSVISVIKNSTSSTVRYNVLIMDNSGSMKGTPLSREKTAAKRFCKTVLNSDGTNYIAIVAFSKKTAKVVKKFSSSYSALSKAISSLTASGNHTNLNAAMKKATTLMSGVSDGTNVMKNIVICSDGLPETGTTSASGRYSKSDSSKYYKYANAVYKTDVSQKNKGYFIYALGFFHNSTGNNLVFGRKLMKDLASTDKYYEITKTSDMTSVFNDIAKTITSVTINQTSLSLTVGGTYKLAVAENGVTKTATWKSSKTSVATVSSSGKVTAKKAGTATITATYGSTKLTCKVTVKKASTSTATTTSISLSASSVTLYVDCSKTLKATTTGSGSVTWSSSDKSIAKVSSSGKVTGVKKGTATITAKIGSKKATCKVTVKNPTISVSPTSKTIYVGKTVTLTATVKGKSSTVTWSTSDKSVATVTSAGKVKGKKAGTATITAKANGVTATCKVTVKKQVVDVTSELTLYGEAARLDNGSIRLTELATWRSGSVWYTNPISTASGFTVYFDYWAGGGRDDSWGGADGIVLNISDSKGLGSAGQDLGFVGGYGVELDSYPKNSGDPSGKHVAIIQGRVSNHLVYKEDDRVDDSAWHTVKVVYSKNTLKVYLDSELLLTQKEVTLESEIYLGVSAATGSGKNAHYIRNFKIS